MTRKALIKAIIAFDLVVVIAFAAYFLRPRDEVPPRADELAGLTVYPNPIALADFSLVDQSGQHFGRDSLKGAWSLLFFGFTSCDDVCPMTLAELKQFSTGLEDTRYAEDTRVMMVSVDPSRDTPEVLSGYMGRLDESYIGLTGELGVISDLADQLYISRRDPPTVGHGDHADHNYQVQHSAHIAVINPAGNYAAIISAPHAAQRIDAAYRYLRSKD